MDTNAALQISIITVCRNSEKFIQETIESVVRQTYRNIQYIIIDGKSTDGTVAIIQKYSAHIDKWISEPDDGMYEAINKGLLLATGDYILILNSDDVLAAPDTISRVEEKIRKKKLDYYYGNLVKWKDNESKKVKLFPVNFQMLLLSTHGTFLAHPCFFISSKVNNEVGGYDTRYKYASDYDYILRVLSRPGGKGKYVDINISKFRIHKNSITASGKIDAERKEILRKHGYYQQPYLKRLFAYYALWIFYKIINLGNIYRDG